MVTTVTDWIGGQEPQVREDDSGLYATRSYLIKGLVGTASTRLVNARTASGVPAIGAAHPATGTLKVRDLSPRLVQRDPQNVEVVVGYFRPSSTKFDVDNPVTGDPTFIDVEYTTDNYYSYQSATGGSEPRGAILKPSLVFRVSRSVTDSIETLNRTYSGKVNSVACRFDTGPTTTWAKYTLLCEGFEGETVKDRSVNRIMGVFSLAPGWDETVTGVTSGGPTRAWRTLHLVNGAPQKLTERFETVNLISSGFLVS